MSSSRNELQISGARANVRPAPSAEEAAAIVAALRAMMRELKDEHRPSPSVWQLAARREALHAEMDAGSGGWRVAARLEQ